MKNIIRLKIQKAKEFWLDSSKTGDRYGSVRRSRYLAQRGGEAVVEASDGSNGSQIAEIICKTGEKIVGKSSKGAEKFIITESSQNGESTP